MGAILTLTYAAAVGRLLGVDPAVYAPWEDAAGRIVVPFNATGGYHPEYDGYTLGTQIKQVGHDTAACALLRVPCRMPASPHCCCCCCVQADVILTGFPWEFAHATFTPATRAADLAVYAAVTDAGGPAMTWVSGSLRRAAVQVAEPYMVVLARTRLGRGYSVRVPTRAPSPLHWVSRACSPSATSSLGRDLQRRRRPTSTGPLQTHRCAFLTV
jgi:hypothetical protein